MSKSSCFVICPIGAKDSDTRKRSDQILKYIIRPVVESLGFKKPVRADHLSQPGEITTQVIQQIVDADLIIADLTDSNPNVFYELAIRHMIEKPLVQIIEEGHKLPFDVASSRTIDIDHKNLDSVNEAQEELRRQIEHVMENPEEVDNPISVTLELKALRASGDPLSEVLADVQEKLAALEGSVDKIEADMSLIIDVREVSQRLEKIDSINNKLTLLIDQRVKDIETD